MVADAIDSTVGQSEDPKPQSSASVAKKPPSSLQSRQPSMTEALLSPRNLLSSKRLTPQSNMSKHSAAPSVAEAHKEGPRNVLLSPRSTSLKNASTTPGSKSPSRPSRRTSNASNTAKDPEKIISSPTHSSIGSLLSPRYDQPKGGLGTAQSLYSISDEWGVFPSAREAKDWMDRRSRRQLHPDWLKSHAKLSHVYKESGFYGPGVDTPTSMASSVIDSDSTISTDNGGSCLSDRTPRSRHGRRRSASHGLPSSVLGQLALPSFLVADPEANKSPRPLNSLRTLDIDGAYPASKERLRPRQAHGYDPMRTDDIAGTEVTARLKLGAMTHCRNSLEVADITQKSEKLYSKNRRPDFTHDITDIRDSRPRRKIVVEKRADVYDITADPRQRIPWKDESANQIYRELRNIDSNWVEALNETAQTKGE